MHFTEGKNKRIPEIILGLYPPGECSIPRGVSKDSMPEPMEVRSLDCFPSDSWRQCKGHLDSSRQAEQRSFTPSTRSV